MNLPLPTDDELLLYFVDDCPNQAVQDFLRRAKNFPPYGPELRKQAQLLFEAQWTFRLRQG